MTSSKNLKLSNLLKVGIFHKYLLKKIAFKSILDFTTTVIHPLRSPADGTPPDQDSDFDDFSDDSKPNSEDGTTKPSSHVVTVTTGGKLNLNNKHRQLLH